MRRFYMNVGSSADVNPVGAYVDFEEAEIEQLRKLRERALETKKHFDDLTDGFVWVVLRPTCSPVFVSEDFDNVVGEWDDDAFMFLNQDLLDDHELNRWSEVSPDTDFPKPGDPQHCEVDNVSILLSEDGFCWRGWAGDNTELYTEELPWEVLDKSFLRRAPR